jgi:uncharacterized protein
MRFRDAVEDLLYTPEMEKAEEITSHRFFSSNEPLKGHLLRVSYLSYLTSRLLGLNSRDCARGGLLHDIGLYQRHDIGLYQSPKASIYVFLTHPEISAKIARDYGENKKVINIVGSHNFPTPFKIRPRYLESLVVWVSDKVDVFLHIYFISNIVDRAISCEMRK